VRDPSCMKTVWEKARWVCGDSVMKAGQLQKPHEPPVPHILLFPPSIKIIGFYGKPAPSQPHLASEPDDLLETHNDRAGVTGNRRLMTGEAARFVYAK